MNKVRFLPICVEQEPLTFGSGIQNVVDEHRRENSTSLSELRNSCRAFWQKFYRLMLDDSCPRFEENPGYHLEHSVSEIRRRAAADCIFCAFSLFSLEKSNVSLRGGKTQQSSVRWWSSGFGKDCYPIKATILVGLRHTTFPFMTLSWYSTSRPPLAIKASALRHYEKER